MQAKNDNPFFTIAVVGYQCESYLEDSLESIDAQTFRDFDVICVVEESSDSSLEICREWAARAVGRNVVSLPKSGSASCSRNYAIEHATGKYIVFLDGDDMLFPSLLERLAETIAEFGEVDVIAYAAKRGKTVNSNPEGKHPYSNFAMADENLVFSGMEAIRRSGAKPGMVLGNTWLNAWRAAFLREHELYQIPGIFLEDGEHLARAWFCAKTMVYIHEPLYFYRHRENSASSDSSTKFNMDAPKALKSLVDFAEKNNAPPDILQVWSNQWISCLYEVMFYWKWQRGLTDDGRRSSLSVFRNDIARLRRFVSNASFPKRIAFPFLSLAIKGHVLPARIFFRAFYYPLLAIRDAIVNHRSRRSK